MRIRNDGLVTAIVHIRGTEAGSRVEWLLGYEHPPHMIVIQGDERECHHDRRFEVGVEQQEDDMEDSLDIDEDEVQFVQEISSQLHRDIVRRNGC